MQLIDTHVGNANDGMITVEFRGEGGELVAVKMSSAGDVQGEAAVTRAKALMVQLTTFADDRDTSQDAWDRSQDDAKDDEKTRSERSEEERGPAALSSFGNVSSSAA